MVAAGFKSVAHVPCIFNGQWTYEVEASQYLRERALLETSSADSSSFLFRAPRYPSECSLRTFGTALVNFLEWCEAQPKPLNWRNVQYLEHIINGYQAHMLDGTWSTRNASLAASTVNARVGEASRFLVWAASRSLREPFKVVTFNRTVVANSKSSAIGHRPKLVQQRAGVVRPDPKGMRMPADKEVAAWHQAVRIERGLTKALMCEVVLKTAVRREEIVQWRMDTLPLDRQSWDVSGDYVTVKVKYGTKGPKHRDGTGDLVGPARFITVPLDLAARLAEYREVRRPELLARYVRAAKTLQDRRARMLNSTKRLFISDFDGRPISAAGLYEAWTKASRLPFPGWSPHLGRHYWACKWLLDAVKKRLLVVHLEKESAWKRREVTATALDVLMFEIKPQLGHISEETSQRYLGWVLKAMILTNISDAYAESLESMALTDVDR